MDISLKLAPEDQNRINSENYASWITKIDKMLKPGTPVLIHNFYKNSLSMGGNYPSRLLFFSEKEIGGDNVFKVKKGKRNYAVVSLERTVSVALEKGRAEFAGCFH